MAKKKPTGSEETGSQHGPRKMVSLSPELYDRLKRRAKQNSRPLAWELRLILERALEEDGPGGTARPF